MERQRRKNSIRQLLEDHLLEPISREENRWLIFLKFISSDLPHRAKAVYMYLKDRSNTDGQCYPAIGTIRKGIKPITENCRAGDSGSGKGWLIKKEQRWRENGGKSSLLYTLIDSS